MQNEWNLPEGYAEHPPTIWYRIRDALSGEVVERPTLNLRDSLTQAYHLSLHISDQEFANQLAQLIQRACAYFYEADDAKYVPLEGVADVVVTDAEVLERIRRLDLGENTREAWRTARDRYPLQELPFQQQRALIEQIEALKREWCFEIVGEKED